MTIDNYLNFIVTSNDHLPLVLEKGDRRFWIPAFIRHRESVEETASFINATLKPWLLYEGGLQLVRDYLEQVDLSTYRPTDAPPSTVSKQELMGFSTADKLEELLAIAVEKSKVLTVKSVKAAFDSEFDHTLSDMAVVNVLLALDCKQRRTKNQRYYITPLGLQSGLSDTSTAKELEACMPNSTF